MAATACCSCFCCCCCSGCFGLCSCCHFLQPRACLSDLVVASARRALASCSSSIMRLALKGFTRFRRPSSSWLSPERSSTLNPCTLVLLQFHTRACRVSLLCCKSMFPVTCCCCCNSKLAFTFFRGDVLRGLEAHSFFLRAMVSRRLEGREASGVVLSSRKTCGPCKEASWRA